MLVDPLLVRGRLSPGDLESLQDGVIQPREWSALSEPVRDAVRIHGNIALRGLVEWGTQLVEDLWGENDSRLGAPLKSASTRPSLEPPTNDLHELFQLERTRIFVGRHEVLQPLLDYASAAR